MVPLDVQCILCWHILQPIKHCSLVCEPTTSSCAEKRIEVASGLAYACFPNMMGTPLADFAPTYPKQTQQESTRLR